MFSTVIGYLQKDETLIGILQVTAASIALALFSQVALPLPFTPVPLSLQTLALFMIALMLGSKKGSTAVILYLTQGTIGLPVFSGGTIDPLWFMGPRAGYLIGFVVAAWLIGRFMESKKEPSLAYTFFALTVGQGALLFIGTLWLAFFVGLSNTLYMGVFPFLVGAALKISFAALSYKSISKYRVLG